MNRIKTQFAVVGGGPAGICGALAAARSGIQTVLIHDRPVLGGNSSSEIRVWSRGAVGAGNFYSEEMGIWGELKLTNFYRNREGNPVFWDEVLLDAVLAEPNLQLLLNTEISQIDMDGKRIVSVSGDQQGTQKHFSVEADVFLDATGDANLGYLAGLPYYLGEAYIPTKDAPLPEKPELLGCSILFYTKREDHPVSFVPPNYAYGLEQISGLINRGGRVVNEKMGGSDCWWFEYGGSLDTIGRLQDITLELKRLVMGVWNYIKNSGLYDAEYYTLEWTVPRRSLLRRMVHGYPPCRRNARHQGRKLHSDSGQCLSDTTEVFVPESGTQPAVRGTEHRNPAAGLCIQPGDEYLCAGRPGSRGAGLCHTSHRERSWTAGAGGDSENSAVPDERRYVHSWSGYCRPGGLE